MSDFDDEKVEKGILCKTGSERSDIRTDRYKEQSGRGTDLDDPAWRNRQLGRQQQLEKVRRQL